MSAAAAGNDNLAVSILLRAVDQVSAPVRRIQGRLGRFRRQAQAIGRRVGFERLGRSLGRARDSAGELLATAGRLTRRLVALGGAGAAAGWALTHGFAASAVETRRWAERLGLGENKLRRLQYAASAYGVQNDALIDGIKELSMRTDEYAETGQGPAAEAFARLGLGQRELARASGDTAELFDLIMSRLRGVENVAARQRLVDEIFGGQGGEQMVAMASASADELARLQAEADALGITVGRDGSRAADRYMQAWRRAEGAMLGVRNTVGAALAPALAGLLEHITDLAVRYQPAIEAWAQDFAAGLPGRIEQVRDEFAQLMDTLTPVIDLGAQVVDRFGAVHTAAAIVAVILGAPLLVPMLRLTGALLGVGFALARVGVGLLALGARAIPLLIGVLKTLAVVAMAHPVLALVTALAAGAVWLIANWDRVGPWFADLWAALAGHVSRGWEAIQSVLAQDPLDLMIAGFQRALQWLADVDWVAVARTGWEALKTLFHWSPLGLMMRGFNRALEWLADVDWVAVARTGWEAMKTLFRWSPLGIMQDAFGRATDWLANIDWSEHGRRLIETLTDGIRSAARMPADAVRGALARVRDLLPFSDARTGPLSDLTRSGQAIPDTLAAGVERGQPEFISAMQSLAASARDALGGALDRVRGYFGGGDATTGEGETVRMPESAMGGGAGTATALPGGTAITVGRVDFRPQVTIHAGDSARARDIAEVIDERLERWRSRDLWVQIQTAPEGAD